MRLLILILVCLTLFSPAPATGSSIEPLATCAPAWEQWSVVTFAAVNRPWAEVYNMAVARDFFIIRNIMLTEDITDEDSPGNVAYFRNNSDYGLRKPHPGAYYEYLGTLSGGSDVIDMYIHTGGWVYVHASTGCTLVTLSPGFCYQQTGDSALVAPRETTNRWSLRPLRLPYC